MATCRHCGTFILFGGERGLEGERYCNKKCYEAGLVRKIAESIPTEEIDALATQIHQGECPQCGGPGPNDVHLTHRVVSLLFVTTRSTQSQIGCRRCGRKRQWRAVGHNMLCGWWSTHGLIFTPLAITSNLHEIMTPPKPDQPSKAMIKLVRSGAANQIAYNR